MAAGELVYRIPVAVKAAAMYVHEYQAKAILGEYGVPIPEGAVAYTPEEAQRVAERLASGVAVKAQILAGARGPAGGVRLCATPADARENARAMLGTMLRTAQTEARGAPVQRVYVERAVDPVQEHYLAVVIDRGRVAVLVSREGGETIEERAPMQAVQRLHVDPACGLTDAQCQQAASILGLTGPEASQLTELLHGAYRAFVELDASLIELNPLVLTRRGGLMALDAKMSFDDNALFRHKRIGDLRDQDDPGTRERTRHGYNYLKLAGNIGCMVNGAGLAMATLDMLQHAGGRPANFLDVPPSASREQIIAAMRTVLADTDVTAVLVNVIGGGVTRCDVVGEAIASACRASGRQLPMVVRFEGTNRDLGLRTLRDRGVVFTRCASLAEAVATVVEQAGAASA
jgi:succinyl-CoA synthetase beta subunit